MVQAGMVAWADSPLTRTRSAINGWKMNRTRSPRCKMPDAQLDFAPIRTGFSMINRTLAASLLFAAAVASVGAQAGPDKEELKLKLPKPMFIGTPTNIKSPNLEAVTGKPRAPFFVP